MAPLRIVFMGTPETARVSLLALLRSPAFEVVGVVTQPDQPKGRGLKFQPSPVKEAALGANLPVLQPASAREENFVRELGSLQPEVVVVVAYGQILPLSILALPQLGCVNVHLSLLPKYRGAAPVQWALLNGDAETGVTIIRLDAGLDTGDILAQERAPIEPGDNSQNLHARLATLGAELLVRTLPEYAAGRIQLRPQPAEGVSRAPKIRKADGQIDWNQPAAAIRNRVRAMVPWPGAFTHLSGQQQSQLLKILAAEVIERAGRPGEILQADKTGVVVACGANALRILELQREGGRRLTAREFLAGQPLGVGQCLG